MARQQRTLHGVSSLARRYGVSVPWMSALTRRADFPEAVVQTGRRRYWDARRVDRWWPTRDRRRAERSAHTARPRYLIEVAADPAVRAIYVATDNPRVVIRLLEGAQVQTLPAPRSLPARSFVAWTPAGWARICEAARPAGLEPSPRAWERGP